MKALRSFDHNGQVISRVENIEPRKLQDNEVRLAAEYSSINYKDALGVTGRGAIFKTLPITGGIDVAGRVVESRAPRFKVGDPVVVTGCGLGESYDGGYAESTVVSAEHVVPIPKGLSARDTMIYGTAGFTAALALRRCEHNGQTPEKGPILVTGASGGVGQFAVQFFAKKNYEVWALSGKPQLAERLMSLGAKKVITPQDLKLAERPLEKVIFGGVIDNVGGRVLAGVIPHVALWGNVACIGLAESARLETTVMPLILRGVSLLGVSSNNTPLPWRLKIWQELAGELKPSALASFVTDEVPLEKIISVSERMLTRETSGRILVIAK